MVTKYDDELFSELSDSDFLANKLYSEISARIALERHNLRMNQKEFAKFLGVSQGMVSRWENCDYNFTIEKIADIFTKLSVPVNFSFSQNLKSLVHLVSPSTPSYLNNLTGLEGAA